MSKTNNKRLKNGICYELNGWNYISVKGSPSERGYAYGYFIAEKFKKVQDMLHFVCMEDYGYEWSYFIDAGTKLIKQTIIDNFNEFYLEMEGIAKGINAANVGTKTSTDEIIAWNNYFLLTEYWFPNKDAGEGGPIVRRGEGGASERCSAFIATGDYTADGKVVIAHNNFSNFIDGQWANTVLDIECDKGHRILMQCFCGWIWSGTDFFVTSKGIIGTETTIGGFIKFENNYPISCRIRKAMQYGNSLDDYVEILLNGNSGDYANQWMFADIHTNEIMAFELGLKYHNIKRTKNGYFIGHNAPYDPKIRNLECVNTGFNDIRRHNGSRKVILDDLMTENKGKIDIHVAKQIISNHYDVYLNKINPCSRTICSHYELDDRKYMSDPARPLPYQPRGALDGCVIDATQASKMSFELKYGSSCDIEFNADVFFEKNKQWKQYQPYIFSRPLQDWTVFSITDDYKIKGNTKNTQNTRIRIKNPKGVVDMNKKTRKNKKILMIQ